MVEFNYRSIYGLALINPDLFEQLQILQHCLIHCQPKIQSNRAKYNSAGLAYFYPWRCIITKAAWIRFVRNAYYLLMYCCPSLGFCDAYSKGIFWFNQNAYWWCGILDVPHARNYYCVMAIMKANNCSFYKQDQVEFIALFMISEW